MPVDVTIDRDANLVTYEATGDVTIDEMKAAFAGLFENPDFKPGMNALCNAKYASFPNLPLDDVKDLVALLGERSAERGKGHRVAVLVRGNAEFGLSSLFEMQTYRMPFEVQVFRNTKEARKWLGV